MYTWNPADKNADITLSNGNLTGSFPGSGWGNARAAFSISIDKPYWECTLGSVWTAARNAAVGIGTESATLGYGIGYDEYGWGFKFSGQKHHNGSSTGYGNVHSAEIVLGTAVHITAGKVWWSIDGVWQNSGNPATGTNPAFTDADISAYPIFPMIMFNNDGGATPSITANFGGVQKYTIPSGFSAFDSCIYSESFVADKIRELIGDRNQSWTDTQITNLIAIATRDISEKALCYESIDPITTSSGTLEYNVPTDAINVFACTYGNKGLIRVNPAKLKRLPINNDGSPEYYYHHNDKIGIYPLPDDTYTVTVYCAKVSKTLTDLPCHMRALAIPHATSKMRLSEGWKDDSDMFNGIYLNSLNYYRDMFYAIPNVDGK